MVHEHPLAYLLGVEGIALMRAFAGEFDREFVDARLSDIRRLLDDEHLTMAAVEVAEVGTAEGYRIWSATYDGPNAAFDLDEPVVGEILDTLPAGVALDAACGTGRVAASLAARGYRVLGIDSSADMLARARERVPGGEYLVGDLNDLPIPGGAVDVVVCSLALTHVPSLRPVMAEFARVLRPGGHLVISDMHAEGVARGMVPRMYRGDGRPVRIMSHRHSIGDYLRAALAAGLHPRRCEELRATAGPVADDLPPHRIPSPAEVTTPWDQRPWSLPALVPEAARAANGDIPAMVVWHFQASTEPALHLSTRL
ncbi:class I SAM-dependent methyltransferase [Sphaerisporangium sp. B11E5]|uniref:class I SAM-dependent methyltransferase n=1 Tax=Sphaerisporangium sp. B11E5 TaxID=3153563 RepID=UPI00325D6A53